MGRTCKKQKDPPRPWTRPWRVLYVLPLSSVCAVASRRASIVLDEGTMEVAWVGESGLACDGLGRETGVEKQQRGCGEPSPERKLPEAHPHGVVEDGGELRTPQPAG